MAEDGTCCVCLDSLFVCNPIREDAPKLAACHPCGHVFHEPCLQQLMDFAKRQGRPCKCPMCNRPKISLLKLFLDVPQGDTPKQAAVDWDANDQEDNVTLERYRAWQQQARQYRERWQTAKENLSKQAHRLQRYQTQVEDLESQLQRAARDSQSQHDMMEQQERQIECLRLEKVQSQRACEHLQRQLELADERVQQAQLQLSETQKSFDTALTKASAQSLHEVQCILQENQRLKALLQRVPKKTVPTKIPASMVSNDKARRMALLTNLGSASSSGSNGTQGKPKLPKRPLAQGLPKTSTMSNRTNKVCQPSKRKAADILDVLDQTDNKRPMLDLLSSQSTSTTKRMRYHSSSSQRIPRTKPAFRPR